MNKNLQEGIELVKEINAMLVAEKPNCDVVVCTPFIHLASVTPLVDQNLVGIGAENCADKASGAYTGEISASMIASTGAKYCILGHSERRAYYGETDEILKEKVQLALENGLSAAIMNPYSEDMMKTYYSEKIRLIEQIAMEADRYLYEYILRAVTENLSYTYLKSRLNIPCGKDMYYDRYRKFFWLLSASRN